MPSKSKTFSFPDMEELLGLPGPVADPLYDLGSLMGIKGTWQRLFVLMTLNRAWELAGDVPNNDYEPELRQQFESELGRALTVKEWDALCARAKSHAKNITLP